MRSNSQPISLSTMQSASRLFVSARFQLCLAWMLALTTTADAPASAAILYPNGQPDPTFQSNAMRLWFKADAGVTQLAGAVSAWADQSTYGYTATQGSVANQPQYTANALGGKPVISFLGNDFFTIAGGPSGQQTMFIVYQDTSTLSWATPVGTFYTTAGSYHAHSDDSQLWTAPYTDAATKNGSSWRDGVLFNGLTTGRPDVFSLDVYQATGPLSQTITTLGADDCCSAGRGIVGGIAEVIIYNAALTADEINDIGAYLEDKYSLNTTYAFVVPEPSTLSLLGLGALGLAIKARRRRTAV